MTTDREKLRELAKAATPGPWGFIPKGLSGRKGGLYGPSDSITTFTAFFDSYAEDAQFCAAANPATVLQLLDEIETLRKANKVMREALEHYAQGRDVKNGPNEFGCGCCAVQMKHGVRDWIAGTPNAGDTARAALSGEGVKP